MKLAQPAKPSKPVKQSLESEWSDFSSSEEIVRKTKRRPLADDVEMPVVQASPVRHVTLIKPLPREEPEKLLQESNQPPQKQEETPKKREIKLQEKQASQRASPPKPAV